MSPILESIELSAGVCTFERILLNKCSIRYVKKSKFNVERRKTTEKSCLVCTPGLFYSLEILYITASKSLVCRQQSLTRRGIVTVYLPPLQNN